MKTLICDDEVWVCDLFQQAAASAGYEDVDIVHSGEDALTQVLRKNYDLITLDIKMPGLSGLEIISLLRSMCPHAVIAIISGNIPDDVPAESVSCADVLLAKPIRMGTFGDLLSAVDRVRQALEQIRSLGMFSAAGEPLDSSRRLALERQALVGAPAAGVDVDTGC